MAGGNQQDLTPHAVVRGLKIGDPDSVLTLWINAEGVGLNESDTRPAIAAFLERNPGSVP